MEALQQAMQAFYSCFVALLIGFCILAPFGLWKLAEIIIFLWRHIHWG